MINRDNWNKKIALLRERIRHEKMIVDARKEQIDKESERIAALKAKLDNLKKLDDFKKKDPSTNVDGSDNN